MFMMFCNTQVLQGAGVFIRTLYSHTGHLRGDYLPIHTDDSRAQACTENLMLVFISLSNSTVVCVSCSRVCLRVTPPEQGSDCGAVRQLKISSRRLHSNLLQTRRLKVSAPLLSPLYYFRTKG